MLNQKSEKSEKSENTKSGIRKIIKLVKRNQKNLNCIFIFSTSLITKFIVLSFINVVLRPIKIVEFEQYFNNNFFIEEESISIISLQKDGLPFI